ncbi:MAG TPA: hypothetical protein VEQ58_01210, partial [Polyangiaceae bacterium]|nr:hypothetical protein [Polyangiaceae bacterium]
MGSRWVAWLCSLAAVLLLSSACGTSGNNGNPTDSGGSSSQPGTVLCQTGQVACNGSCVDVKVASDNCGSCGNVCTAPAVCANGACTTTCAAGTQKCGDSCANLTTDAAHCGSCDKACDAGVPCYGGVCG